MPFYPYSSKPPAWLDLGENYGRIMHPPPRTLDLVHLNVYNKTFLMTRAELRHIGRADYKKRYRVRKYIHTVYTASVIHIHIYIYIYIQPQ